MARFLDTLIEEAAIPTPLTLVVADFGATYGLSWAVTFPQKVKCSAIVGGSNFSSRYRWHGAARLLRIPLLGEVAMATVTLSSHEKMMRHNAPLVSPEYVRETYALSLAKPETRRMMLKLYRSVNPKDFLEREDRLHHLTAHVPTLVLWGTKIPLLHQSMQTNLAAHTWTIFLRTGTGWLLSLRRSLHNDSLLSLLKAPRGGKHYGCVR